MGPKSIISSFMCLGVGRRALIDFTKNNHWDQGKLLPEELDIPGLDNPKYCQFIVFPFLLQ